VIGTGAHASQPELGVNAVSAAGHLLEALTRVELATAHPLLGNATLTPTVIEGGSSPNSVPDRCTLTIDRRLLPGEDPRRAIEDIRTALETVKRDTKVEYELTERALFVPTEIDPATEIVVAVQDATELAIQQRAQIEGMAGSTDARFLIGEGIPTVIFGPGHAREAHTIDESIAIEDLRLGTIAYAAVICRFLGVR
jgi:acetylornithine deacetylase/succinyl-diaminopimelate desuccinylase-like protein